MRIASGSSSYGMMVRTGPKISSRAIVMSLRTLANTVGFTKYPLRMPSGRPGPPVTSSAPSSMPFLMRRCTFSNCASLASGPMVVPSASGSPTLTASAARFAAAAAWAILERGTSMRVGALHDWPVLRAEPCTPAATACSRSAASRMMLADLPPSSCATRFTVGAAAVATATPARVEPAAGRRRAREPDRRPHLLRDGLGHLLVLRLVDLDDALDEREALLGAGLRVRLEGTPGGGDRLVDVGGRAKRDPGDRVLGGGVDDREVVRPRGRHPLPVDVELAAVLHVSPPVMSRRTPDEIFYPSRRAAARGAPRLQLG